MSHRQHKHEVQLAFDFDRLVASREVNAYSTAQILSFSVAKKSRCQKDREIALNKILEHADSLRW